jgi:uncharacterized protein
MLYVAAAAIVSFWAFGFASQVAQEVDVVAFVFQENLRKAEQGDVNAQQSVGFAYEIGLGVAIDEKEALRWYEKAASGGSAMAMSTVGGIFEKRKDYQQAFDWYSKAAEHRYAHAIFRLAILHQQGWHGPKDLAKAATLLEQAAWLNSAEAQNYLGAMYYQGQLVTNSPVRAYAWMNLAARTRSESAKLRDMLERHLTPEQLAEAQKLSLEWAEKLK